MSKIFTRTFRVRWSELDATGQVSPSSYMRYLVETAYDWGDALGLSTKDAEIYGLFWLIRETQIDLLRPMKHDDVFDFTIWMVNWQRVRGTRCFEIKLKESNEIIAQGSQHIVCMDLETLRPTTPPADVIDNFKLEQPRIFPFERFPKIDPPVVSFTHQRKVEWQDLDAMEHVNNAIYVTYAEEAGAQELAALGWPPAWLSEQKLAIATRRIHIQYQSPALWGENLSVCTHELSLQQYGGSRYVGFSREDGSQVAECIQDWRLVDRESGLEQPMPGELGERLAK
ncbi:MAG TPA: acyl-CoA thioesterase [Anaerolineales bacterium]|jgi:YbgC/YbaW family acyl-CoA thioester hydrolase